VRVIAGSRKGHKLSAPRGLDTRPTSDRVRENVFNLVGPVDDAQVLDLFAGSGALGIEALSRGAASAVLVDSAPAAARTIRRNLDALGVAAQQAEVRRQDVRAFLRGARDARHEYDLVFLDPPYRFAPELGPELSPALAGLLAPDGRVVSESDRRAPLDLDLPLTDERRYGDTLIRIHEPPR
jgi:16S rRNA (guanine966-N2)-methyltransferase